MWESLSKNGRSGQTKIAFFVPSVLMSDFVQTSCHTRTTPVRPHYSVDQLEKIVTTYLMPMQRAQPDRWSGRRMRDPSMDRLGRDEALRNTRAAANKTT
jgi:hypothetical protein